METFQLGNPTLYGEIHPCENPRGVIVFCHGLGEHIGRYTRLIEFFNREKFVCAGTDHIGHGKSPGKRGDAPSYDIFLDEIEQVASLMQGRYPGLPMVLYGHSMGGNIALNFITGRNTSQFSAAVASSPWITLPTSVPPAKRFLAGVMNMLYPAFTAPNELDPAGISHDKDIVEQYINDPLVHDRISVRLFKMMSEYGESLLARPDLIKTPTLLIHGTADPMTSFHGSKNFSEQNVLTDFVGFPDMYHELHHENIHDEVLKTVGDWLNSQLSKATP